MGNLIGDTERKRCFVDTLFLTGAVDNTLLFKGIVDTAKKYIINHVIQQWEADKLKLCIRQGIDVSDGIVVLMGSNVV